MSSRGRHLAASEIGADRVVTSIDEALEYTPSWALVAAPANRHIALSLPFLGRGVPTLIEKPLATDVEATDVLAPFEALIDVGYFLRHLTSLQLLRRVVRAGEIGQVLSARIEVGQFLPDWRAGIRYQDSVSARKNLGGGALLELSHEVDYMCWIFGVPSSVYASVTQTGTLDVDVEDQVEAVFEYASGPTVSLHLDLLQRVATRTCKVVGTTGTLIWDYLQNRLIRLEPDGEQELFVPSEEWDNNQIYCDELISFSQFASGKARSTVGLQAARQVVSIVGDMRASSEARTVKDVVAIT
jgi:predicted dehydrogenase